ncbi:MAG: biotin-dependent carboxyltransferase family protein [Verrucomicrobia bacterium]|jgi:antagonist of KipI|nr:biotin-dependent carboxyltransferase family protein [Verrucomicrobiota bacterium]
MAALGVFEVLAPGILTTVTDLGRYGFARYGVAPTGGLDGFSLRIANLLVGNPENAAVLETLAMGLRLKVLSEVSVAVTGGNLTPLLGAQPLPMWRSLTLRPGEVLSFTAPARGFRSYLAVHGGVDVPLVLGSRATNLSSGFGGLEGRPLRKGDLIAGGQRLSAERAVERVFPAAWIPDYPSPWRLRVVWGPQEEQFTDESRQTFVSNLYSVSSDSNRTGIRLNGAALQVKAGVSESIISEGVVAGAIQVPGDGQPIILLGETVSGGYRKIATVISADLPSLGQIMPGDQVGFSAVGLAEALQALRLAEERVRSFALSAPA